MKRSSLCRAKLQRDGGMLLVVSDDPYGITFDGCTGDYREELWADFCGQKYTVAISNEFGFEDVFEGDVRGSLKGGYS